MVSVLFPLEKAMVTLLGILLRASGAGRSGAGLTGLVGASALAMGVTLMSSGIHEGLLLCPASVLGPASVGVVED